MPALQTSGSRKLFYAKWLRWAKSTKDDATDGTLLSALKVVEEGGNYDASRAKIGIWLRGPAQNWFKNRLLKQEL